MGKGLEKVDDRGELDMGEAMNVNTIDGGKVCNCVPPPVAQLPWLFN
jgi:hypothetical protein